MPKEEEESAHSSKSPAVIRVLKAPVALWTSIRAWVHEDARFPTSRQVFLEKARTWNRTFPQFRLPENHLRSQLQQYSENRHTTRFLKPSGNSDTIKPKRIRPRKSAPKPPSPPLPPLPPDGQELISKAKPPPKRRKSAIKPPPDISCTVCGTKGVPLLRGGRICRSCLQLSGDNSPSTSSFRSGIFITTVAPPSVGNVTDVDMAPPSPANEAGPSSEKSYSQFFSTLNNNQ